MATWQELRGYISTNYKVSEDTGGGLKLLFETEGGRSQLVFLTHAVLLDGAEEWVVIESPFAEVGKIDLNDALRAVGDMVCGGMGLFLNKYVTLRHAVPLLNLDINEFERPFTLLITSADRLEKAFTRADKL